MLGVLRDLCVLLYIPEALNLRNRCNLWLLAFGSGFVQQCRAPAGAESFSFYFLSFAILGNTIRDCYDWTALAFQAMGNPAGQDPWMDDNGDGLSNKWDGAQASRHVLGRYPAFGLNAPTILSVATTQTISLGQSVVLWARLDEAVAAKEVWAIVVPKNATYSSGQPVTNLTRVSLAFSPTLNRWQATWQPGSKHAGQNTVTYFALSEDSLGTRLVATPKTSGLIVRGGTSVRIPWRLFE